MAITHSPNIISDDLVYYLDAANKKSYPGSGDLWTDLTGQGHNFTLVNFGGGDISFNSDNGGCINLNGGEGYIQASHGVLSYPYTGMIPVSSLSNFTYEIWLKATAVETASRRVLLFGSASVSRFSIYYDNLLSNNNRIYIKIGSTTDRSESATGLMTTDWRCVTVAWERNTVPKLYIDGVLQTLTTSVSVPQNTYGIQTVRFGSHSGYEGTSSFNGKIANVKFYNRTLTAAEVLQNFNALRDRYDL